MRNEITNNISPEIKWRRDKQPLRWFGDDILFNKYEKIVKENVLDSELLKNFYDRKNIEYLCNKNFKHLILR